MAQPDDFIAERVWPDIDIDLRHRTWSHHHNQNLKSDPNTLAVTHPVPHAHTHSHTHPHPHAHNHTHSSPQAVAAAAVAAAAVSANQPPQRQNTHHPQPPQPPHQTQHLPPHHHQPQHSQQLSQPHLPIGSAATPPQPPPLYPSFSSVPGTASTDHHPARGTPLAHLSAAASSLPLATRNDPPSYLTPLHHNYNALAGVKNDPPRWHRQSMQPQHPDSAARHLAAAQPSAAAAAAAFHRPPPHHTLPQSQFPSPYSPYHSFVANDPSTPHASSEIMERALRDASGSTATTNDSLMQTRASGGPTPIPSPLAEVERHPGSVSVPGSIVAPEHAINAFGQIDTVSTMNPRSMVNGASVPAVGVNMPLNGICKTKQRRRYAKPKSSRYCHLCARHERAVTMYPCGNVELGICQKSVCAKCFDTYNLDLAAAKLPRVPGQPRWTCPHCQGSCPKKAKCHSYDRQTERRRLKTRELKRQLALKMQAAASAS